MKARFKVLLPLLLLLWALPAAVQAQFLYTTNSGAITITGYTGPGGAVTIPSTTDGLPVTSIGEQAFVFCFGLTSITIPDGVTSLGDSAFYSCSSLTNITIPNSLTNIRDLAFANCTSLTGVVIPGSVTSIGEGTFDNCISLTTVMIPDSVTSIGGGAFYSCTNLANITVGTGVTNIGDYAFYGCSTLTGACFRGSAPAIGSSVFSGDTNATVYHLLGPTNWGPTFGGLATVLWNPTVLYTYTTNNGTITVTGYTGSTGVVTISDTINFLPVTSIGDNAFNYCNTITDITIPNGVTTMGSMAFTSCTNLTRVVIGDGVTNIGVGSFGGCTELSTVIIGKNVADTGGYTFLGCTNLTALYFRGNAPYCYWQSFSPCSPAVYYLPWTTGWKATGWGPNGSDFPTLLWELPVVPFNYTTNNGTILLTQYTGPGGAVTIPTTINFLPVTTIGEGAFYGCSNVTSVTASSSVTNIGNSAFRNCPGLTTVCLWGNAPTIGSDAFAGDNNAIVYYVAGTTGWGWSYYGDRPAVALSFDYTITGGSVTITRFNEPYFFYRMVTIPSMINSLPVTAIADNAFDQYNYYAPVPRGITIPGSPGITWGFFIGWFEGGGKKTELLE